MKSFQSIAILYVAVAVFACGGADAPPTHVDLHFQRIEGTFDPGHGFQAHQGRAIEQREVPFLAASATENQPGTTVQSLQIELNCLSDEAEFELGDIQMTLVADGALGADHVFRATAGQARIFKNTQTEIVFEQVVVEDGLGNSFLVTGNASWERDPAFH